MQFNNSTTYSENKDPSLKCRYAKGLGDLIACILHGPLSHITYFITKKRIPCAKCSMRADALNMLIPIPFWKLYFKNIDELLKSLSKEMQDAGYQVAFTDDGKGIRSSKFSQKQSPTLPKTLPTIPTGNLSDYNLISSGDNMMGDFIIRIQIFKRK